MTAKKLNIAIVGLGFGKEFIPIYQHHPHTSMYAICQRTQAQLDEVGRQFGVEKRYSDFDELIRDPQVDAVHINSPIHLHAPQSIAALRAGKHVACTVPAATTVEECREIVRAARESRKNYMMMETAIYTREFLFVRELRDTGKLGRIQFMRGSHQQEMAGWPGYWEGLPPMHYATHAVSPCLALVRGEAEYVSCFGSGRIAEKLIAKYGSPFAVESALFKVRSQQLAFEVTRSLFETARQYIESSTSMVRSSRWSGPASKARSRSYTPARSRSACPCRTSRVFCQNPSSASPRKAFTMRSMPISRSYKAAVTAALILIW